MRIALKHNVSLRKLVGVDVSGGVALSLLVAATLLALVGCRTPAGVPVTMDELQTYYGKPQRPYPYPTIASENLLRVLDADLAPAGRIASLSVTVHLVGDNRWYADQFASLLTTDETPTAVRHATLIVLARQDYPQLDPYVFAALSNPAPDVLQQTLLDWLTRHRKTEWLSDVVHLWAQADPADIETEMRFRRAVETIAGRTWSDAVLAGLNRPGFASRRSALDVLAARLTDEQLLIRISRLRPQVIAVEALQFTIRQLDYVPVGEDLLATVEAYAARKAQLDAAVAMAHRWNASGDYAFSIRDVHLLCGLTDPQLVGGNRPELMASAAGRVRRQNSRVDSAMGGELFAAATPLERLTTPDLVRLILLSDMLDNPTTRRAIQTVMMRSAETPWGGLVILADGDAKPRLYQAASAAGAQEYLPSDLMRQDARFCLAYVHGRLNTSTTGGLPTTADLARVDLLGLPGLSLTMDARGNLIAVYYDAGGVIVPVGVFEPEPSLTGQRAE